MFDINRLTENIFLITSAALAICAWIIALGGAAAFAKSGVVWWIIVYELLLLVGTVLVFMSGTFLHYRMVLLALLAISISLLTTQIDAGLAVAHMQGGAGAFAAGYIILIIVQFLWVFVFGSEPNSYLGRFGHGWSSMNNSVEHHGMSEKITTPPQVQHAGDKTMVDYPAVATGVAGGSAAASHPAAASTAPQPNLDYAERVEALHDYDASPDDPNELSFKKGEALDVVERKGNWWQARKLDGTVGIIPSNYFA
ncbi:hypothetical protein BCR43DRAFT_481477 [Syncephalastrum racemosum]|uniref:SH3 domain-containing protein n=1 Tax=Syncephalastrum racemosum TaxID=13706 RepID=A0A1X2HSD6_SYNRA|nr:hypothetical protein BCR43DRAFT_481477 [Syncephalastrum racemosum]